jgi:murein L,D-transpeptidase YcbB/YkuD
MLARYRELAADSSLLEVRLPESTLRPGDSFAGSPPLARLLTRLGDTAPAATFPATSVYEEPLVSAVRRFQKRHGLGDDGVIGAATRAALRVRLSARVRQIELALERLRWLPHLDPQGFLAVNIPMFQLWAWESIPPNGAPAFGMNAIVGRSLDTRTPVFVAQMEHVVFRPYWNVPRSILRGEILPAIERDPGYLDRHDMEIVAGQSDDDTVVPPTADNLSKLRQGRFRVRQRPGPANSLGLVKFVFPNDENVYLHGTPARQLFGRARRDFSHGCVRVEDPVALAEWALRREPDWNRERILTTMTGTKTVHVKLSRPIQVFLFYVTAVVMPDDGLIHFAEDIYGHDAKLDRALRDVAP